MKRKLISWWLILGAVLLTFVAIAMKSFLVPFAFFPLSLAWIFALVPAIKFRAENVQDSHFGSGMFVAMVTAFFTFAFTFVIHPNLDGLHSEISKAIVFFLGLMGAGLTGALLGQWAINDQKNSEKL